MIPKIVYLLCALTGILCAVLLARRWRNHPNALLFWSALCFFCLAITNVLLFADLVLLPQIDLTHARSLVTLLGMAMLIYGLIESQR